MHRNINQKTLYYALRELFPSAYIEYEPQAILGIRSPTTGYPYEYDVWIKDHQLLFEFQDIYHFKEYWYGGLSLDTVQQKDLRKSALAANRGFTVIPIPCWWDGKLETLAAEIRFHRPDLLAADIVLPPLTPLNPLHGFYPEEIVGVRGIMLPSFPTSGFHKTMTSNNWWMGEKLEGIRSIWNGIAVFNKFGKELQISQIMVQYLPKDVIVDFEIWPGRGMYSGKNLVAYLNSCGNITRLIAFDSPAPEIKFEDRYQLLLKHISIYNPITIVTSRVLCTGNNHMALFAKSILQDHGEGIILRECSSLHIQGRSDKLIKLKAYKTDKDALVESVNVDGSLELRLTNDRFFAVHKKNVLIPSPRVGDVVVVSYNDISRRDIPKDAKVTAVKEESWLDLRQLAIGELAFDYSKRPLRYWDEVTARMFFDDIARKNQLNPQDPETWQKITYKAVMKHKGGAILKKFGGYYKALVRVYPQLRLQKKSFYRSSIGTTYPEQREFFERYAQEKNFNPHTPTDWYKQSRSNIGKQLKGYNITRHHGGSVKKAIMANFNNIGLDESKFVRVMESQFDTQEKITYFMENLGKELNFTKMEDWYSIDKYAFREKGLTLLNKYHNGSPSNAVVKAFPEHKWLMFKFNRLTKGYWEQPENVRQYMEWLFNTLDLRTKFDWYKLTRADLNQHYGATLIQKKTIPQIVLEAFPEHDWDERMFK